MLPGYARFMARQLRKPSGLFGRFVLPRRLSRINVTLNEATLAALDLQPDDRVLEVGFGPGDLIARAVEAVAAGFSTAHAFRHATPATDPG